MNDRVLSALRVLGIGAPPIASLERDGAFFALLDDTLIYQDAGGTRRVTLRDLTRIHSDQEGLLRVETPAGTALTASLLGYDSGRVQSFFAQVRDATARAKHLPGAPLPGVGGQKTFGTAAPKPAAPAPASPALTPPAPAAPPEAAPPAKEVIVIGTAAPEAAPETAPPEVVPTAAPVPAPAPDLRGARVDPPRRSASGAPSGPARPPTRLPAGGDDLEGETVRVIRAGSGGVVEAPAPVAAPPTRPTPPPVTPTAREDAAPAPTPGAALPSTPPAAAEVVPVPAAEVTPKVRPARAEGLAARAEAVAALVSRLRLLGAVLGLAALGLAAFQFAGGTPLLGLWTLIAGGVGAIALLAFADVAGLVAALAREVGGRSPAPAAAEAEKPGDAEP